MGFNGNVLKFDKNNNVEDFTFILSTRNHTHLGKINNVKRDTVHYKANLNSKKEISFEICKNSGDYTEQLWNSIVDFRLVFIKEVNDYFEIKVTYKDALEETKIITGTSLCEAELSQINIYGTEINTEIDLNREDSTPDETVFYNPDNPSKSLLHRVLSYAPHYSIKYVDSSLYNLVRILNIDGITIYDFLTGKCAKEFNCLFAFNSADRSISVYDLYSNCLKCGHRGGFNDVCPKCGSTNIVYFGEDTLIYVNKENLTNEVQLETDTDSVKNCFKLSAGDDDMTNAVIAQNPNGTAYIYAITNEQREDMSDEFIERFDTYNELYDSKLSEYQQLSEDIYELEEQLNYYKYTMMPEPEDDKDGESTESTVSISEKELAKLTVENLSPLGVATLSSITSVETINNSLESYAKIYVNTSLVKVKAIESTFTYSGEDENGCHYGQWIGKLKLTVFAESTDTATTETLTINVHDNYVDYIQQKALKDIGLLEMNEDSVFDVLGIEDIDTFKEALTLYCLTRLNTFKKAIETAITTLGDLGTGNEETEYYNDIYLPYYDKLEACELEIDRRSKTIADLEENHNTLVAQQKGFQELLDFKNYLGEELYNEFCMYKREQEYNNSNYVSDGLTNAEKMEHARQFLETASQELFKSSQRQKFIITTLFNLLSIPEMRSIVNKFALGNFIRIQADNDVYRLRLVSFEINFSDLTVIPVEFSDMTKTTLGLNDVKSILDLASSMAKNYDTVSTQANKGYHANSSINQLINNGLNNALIGIKNNINEDVVIDNNGILFRSWDDSSQDYLPNQFRGTHNKLLFTSDNWRTANLGIGEMSYVLDNQKYTDYGIITKYLISGKIIAGDIYSADYSADGTGSHFDLENDEFSFGDGTLKFDKINGLQVTGNITSDSTISGAAIEGSTIKGGSISIGSNFSVDSNGNLVGNGANFTNANVSGVINTTDGNFTGIINAKKGGSIGGFTIGENAIYKGTNSMSSTTAGIYLGTNGIRQYNSTDVYVNIQNGVLTANGANITGTITAKLGKIGGWDITNTYIGNSQTGGSIYITSKDDSSEYWIRTHNATNGGGTRTFSISKTGQLFATGADINGKITATEGQIASISIQKDQGLFYSPLTNTSIGFGLWATTEHANIAFHAGSNNQNIGGAPFRVYYDGKVVTNNIIATGGTIGGFEITNSTFGSTKDGICFYQNGYTINFRGTVYTCYIIFWEGSSAMWGITKAGEIIKK